MTYLGLPGAPYSSRRNGQLFVEEVALSNLAQQHGTPLFVYSKAAMLGALAPYQKAFAGRDAQVHYAMKANSSLGVLQVFAQAGCGFDIVSGGELGPRAGSGWPSQQSDFSGVGKTRAEMRQALGCGHRLLQCGERSGTRCAQRSGAVAAARVAPVSIRVNPNVDPQTHPYISTGLEGQ
jgi:diaminopimelate decarboxylase